MSFQNSSNLAFYPSMVSPNIIIIANLNGGPKITGRNMRQQQCQVLPSGSTVPALFRDLWPTIGHCLDDCSCSATATGEWMKWWTASPSEPRSSKSNSNMVSPSEVKLRMSWPIFVVKTLLEVMVSLFELMLVWNVALLSDRCGLLWLGWKLLPAQRKQRRTCKPSIGR